MIDISSTDEQVFWYHNHQRSPQRLTQSSKTDVVIVGGGMAGLSAAQAFRNKGCSVILIEQYYCGAGASGKSSGFITPDSELDLSHYVSHYGDPQGHHIWEFARGGCELIRSNIATHRIPCDYQEQDSLILASHAGGLKEIKKEATLREKFGYKSTYYSSSRLHDIITTKNYDGGIRYGETFGINSYAYCQAMKQVLREQNVHIYEETPALEILPSGIRTPYGLVSGNYYVIATDWFLPHLGILSDLVFPVQTLLMMSAPLQLDQIKKIFPHEWCMVWDTDLIYTYYRITGDNRLLIGGATLPFTYELSHNRRSIMKKLTHYIEKNFPSLSVRFDYAWTGLIGVSKDFVPLAGSDKRFPNRFYISAATGLPWAAALGRYSAAHLLDNDTTFDAVFDPYRSYPVEGIMQSLLGKKFSFMISHGIETFLN